jgi:hypothetical protein
MPPVTQRQLPRATTVAKPQSVLDRIKPIGFRDDDPIQVLLYGRSGTGKTTLWSTFPGPILCMVCSGGKRPGELRSIDTADNRSKIREVLIQNSLEIRELTDHVGQSGAYKTLVLDHASGLQDRVLAELLRMDEVPAQKTWGLATQQTYGQCTAQCKDLMRGMLSLPVNVVIVAQEREFTPETSEDSLITPYVSAGLTPSLTGWLNTAVDYICQTYIRQKEETVLTTIGQGKSQKQLQTRRKVKGVEYCLRTAPDPVYTTKFRLPRGATLPDMIVDPSYEKILEVIHGGQNALANR